MAETWMTMIFRHGFFHGDPHPANILVLGPEPDRPRRLRSGREAHRRRHLEDDARSSSTPRTRTSTRSRGDSPISASATEREQEAEFRAELRELYYKYYGAPLAEIDPIQVIREGFAADLLA